MAGWFEVCMRVYVFILCACFANFGAVVSEHFHMAGRVNVVCCSITHRTIIMHHLRKKNKFTNVAVFQVRGRESVCVCGRSVGGASAATFESANERLNCGKIVTNALQYSLIY